jgi:hypothetical protein
MARCLLGVDFLAESLDVARDSKCISSQQLRRIKRRNYAADVMSARNA